MTVTSAAILVGLYGLLIGSFVNVLIDRLPVAREEENEYGEMWDFRPWRQVVGGRSRCSSCAAPIRPWQNIPVVSYLVLRGRCRSCGERYGAYHLAVELVVPLLGVLAVLGIGLHPPLWLALWLIPPGVAISGIDFRTLMVPTRLVWPTFAVSVAIAVGIAAYSDRWSALLGGLIGVGVLAGPLFLLWWFMPSGMGFGDVRLTVLLGWIVGFVAMFVTDRPVLAVYLAVCSLAIGAVVGIVVGVALRAGFGKAIPFGPALFAAALFCVVMADRILDPLI